MENKPLLVQSDRTLLLDMHHDNSDEVRSRIMHFAELLKSPEHIHTYQISQLSLWNACYLKLTYDDIISTLKEFSRFEIPASLSYFIKDNINRYGAIILEEYDDDNFLLTVKNSIFFNEILSNSRLKCMLTPESNRSFLLKKYSRGNVKLALIKIGFPVEDLIPLKKGLPLPFSLRERTLSGKEFKLHDYQEDAVREFLGENDKGKGFGNIILPCGAGKTVVGIKIMECLQTSTLIICPNVAALHQWKRELLDKTTLKEEQIGEYSGERKEIKEITLSTYQVLVQRKGNKEIYLHLDLIKNQQWGFIIYDEVHVLPAACFKLTNEIQALYRLGLTATLVREDQKEDEVFALIGPKRYDTPWAVLEDKGFIAKAYCHEIRVELPEELTIDYARAIPINKFKIASQNPIKLKILGELIEKHQGDSIIIIAQYLEQLNEIKALYDYPLITGSTKNKRREEIYDAFRSGDVKIIIVSKIANYAIDLPDASVLIQLSGAFGSRQEEAQRLGRILRPKKKDSHFYSLVTMYTLEEEYNQKRQQFLCEQGYNYTLENYTC